MINDKAIDTIVFDFGGVLINWNPKYLYRKLFETEKEVNFFLENVCHMAWNEEQDAGRSWADAIALKTKEYPVFEKEISAYWERWDEMLGGLMEDSVSILKELKESGNYKIYGLTNWSAETFPIAQKRYEMLQWFDGIVVSGEEQTRKPFRKIYEILFDRYDIQPEHALFIDDNARNVAASVAFGMDAILFDDANKLRKTLEKKQIL